MDKGKGLVDLLQSAVDGGVQAVRQVHVTMIKESCDTIQALLGEPKAAKIIGEVQIAGSTVVYEAIRLVNRTVGTLAKAALLSPRMVVPLEEDSINTNTPDTAEPPLPQKPHPLLPILNGIVGDFLHNKGNPLAIPMELLHRSEPPQKIAMAVPRLAVFVHGLVADETVWNFSEDPATSYGSLLEQDLGYTPLYLRYNTGLHISENARQFADLMEALLDRPGVQVDELLLIGHSMGGLVIRAAAWYGSQNNHRWTEKVKTIIYIASPHQGAPLEKLGNLVTGILKGLPQPYLQVAGDIINQRSDGIKDLRFGYLTQGEWSGGDPDAILTSHKELIPLLGGVRHHAISGTLTKNPAHPAAVALGDFVVRNASALGQSPLNEYSLPFTSVRVFPRMGHLRIAHDPLVYEQIKQWCR